MENKTVKPEPVFSENDKQLRFNTNTENCTTYFEERHSLRQKDALEQARLLAHSSRYELFLTPSQNLRMVNPQANLELMSEGLKVNEFQKQTRLHRNFQIMQKR